MVKKKSDDVRTTVILSRTIWRAARIKAMDDDMDLSTVVSRALERYLGVKAE
jgi:hypothetical protein